MTPDELRALAEALDEITPVMGLEELHHMETLDRAADYLLACADAQPAGWTDRHTSVTRFALWCFINDAYARANYAARSISREPVENVAKFQDDARTAEEARAMLAAAPAVPQAEPKREPLSEAQCAELSEWMWQEIGISLSNATLRRLEKKLNSIGDSDER